MAPPIFVSSALWREEIPRKARMSISSCSLSPVDRCLIIGEAAWKLSQSIKDQHPQAPWRQIEGMRHIMVHDYFKVDWDIVYGTARTHVPALKPLIESMLRSVPPDASAL